MFKFTAWFCRVLVVAVLMVDSVPVTQPTMSKHRGKLGVPTPAGENHPHWRRHFLTRHQTLGWGMLFFDTSILKN